MKNKLRKEVLASILLTLFISIIINMSFQYINDRFFDDELDRYLFAVDRGIEKFDISMIRHLDDSEFVTSVFINSISLSIGCLYLWFSIGRKAKYIKELSNSLIYIGEGNLDYKAPIRQNNELTELANSINELSFAFKERIEYEKEQEKVIASKEKDFIMGISHDIRTPLTSIIGYLHVLIDKQYESDQEREEYTQTMLDKVYMLKNLTDTLLESEFYSKQKHYSSRSIDKERFMSNTIYVFQKLMDDRLNFMIKDSCEDFSVIEIVDISRVISNLASNVNKYADYKSPIKISLHRNCNYIELDISNKSIDPIADVYHKFTDRFYRFDSSRILTNGYGLGLSICKNIMESQDGYLKVKYIDESLTITLGFKINEA